MTEFPQSSLPDLIKVNDESIVRSTQWYNELVSAINDLITFDFHRLVQLLYQSDVPEQKLKVILTENTGTDAAKIIADLLLERQLQRIKSRNSSQPVDLDIPGEERW